MTEIVKPLLGHYTSAKGGATLTHTDAEYYGYAWWGWAIRVVGIIGLLLVGWVILAFGLLFAAALLPVGIILAPALVWVVFGFIGLLSCTPDIIIQEDSIKIRFFWRWVSIPWNEIVDMAYCPWMGHVIRAKRITPFHWVLGNSPWVGLGFPWSSMHPIFFLAPELVRRDELFWEIRRRASRAQGKEIPYHVVPGPRWLVLAGYAAFAVGSWFAAWMAVALGLTLSRVFAG